MTKKKTWKVAATLTVHRIPDMTDTGRKNICNWLRRLAKDIAEEPETFSKTFRARYCYEDLTHRTDELHSRMGHMEAQ